MNWATAHSGRTHQHSAAGIRVIQQSCKGPIFCSEARVRPKRLRHVTRQKTEGRRRGRMHKRWTRRCCELTNTCSWAAGQTLNPRMSPHSPLVTQHCCCGGGSSSSSARLPSDAAACHCEPVRACEACGHCGPRKYTHTVTI